jgi:hypothetical protein
MSHKKEYVSGPNNLVRLEGEIEGIKKVFYLFMDIHLGEAEQLECKDIRSSAIKQYLVKTFDDLKTQDKKYDFLLETFPDCYRYNNHQVGIYLDQLRKLFSAAFDFDFKTKKVKKSNEFPNIRFHYIDIRSYLGYKVCNPFGLIYEIIDYVHLHQNLGPNNVLDIYDSVNLASSRLYFLYQTLYGKKERVKKKDIIQENYEKVANYTEKDFQKTIKYIVNKIQTQYTNNSIKKKINDIIDGKLKRFFEKYFEIVPGFLDQLKKSYEDLSQPVDKLIEYRGEKNYLMTNYWRIVDDLKSYMLSVLNELFDLSFAQIYTIIMDLYFLRRALDKSYMTNIIAYTGAHHSANYISILVQLFDFKITHANYSKYEIDKLNREIKKMELLDTEKVNSYFMPEYLEQCIEVSKFPQLFS